MNPDRRMRFLQWLYAECDVFIFAQFTGKSECTLAPKSLLDQEQGFVSNGAAILKIGTVRSEKIRHNA